MKLTLPYPPSVNTYWRANGNRRFISKAGVLFKQAVREYISGGNLPSFGSSRLAVGIVVCPRSKRRFDLDNLLKAILDSLQDAGLYEDDEQVDELRIVRGEPCSGGSCIVEITKIDTSNLTN